MLVFAHLGIGKLLCRGKKFPFKPMLLGTLLPDLIDKPIYYLQVFWTGKTGADLGLFSSTRTIGHTLFFALLLGVFAAIFRSKSIWALTIGVLSHLVLDNFLEPFRALDIYSSRVSLFFPYYDWTFTVAKHRNFAEQMQWHLNRIDLSGECLGIVVFLWSRIRRLFNRIV